MTRHIHATVKIPDIAKDNMPITALFDLLPVFRLTRPKPSFKLCKRISPDNDAIHSIITIALRWIDLRMTGQAVDYELFLYETNKLIHAALEILKLMGSISIAPTIIHDT